MTAKISVRVILCAATCFVWADLGFGTSLILNFSSTGGTILDVGGQGTGFTARLGGTGANIPANDPLLDIDTALGVVHIDPPNVDYNGQVNMADAENPGINLSSLGFTGTQDFAVTATFINIPDNTAVSNPDQLGLYVGTASGSQMRVGFINFDNFLDPDETRSNEGFGVNTNGTADSNARFFGADVGTTMTVEIGRSGGVWRALVNGIDRLPNTQTNGSGAPAPPIFLNSASDLTVGVFALDLNGDDTGTFDLDTFTAIVAAGCDANGDSMCTIADFNLISDNLFRTVPAGTLGDLNGNGVVGYEDFRQWKNNFIPAAGQEIPQIPEPTTWLLLLSAFLGVSISRCRKR